MAKKQYLGFLIISLLVSSAHSILEEISSNDRVIQVLEDKIEAENFTYYRLHRDGNLRLELTSLKGDVDMYASSKIQHPSYDDYDLKSASCGTDIVTIEESMQRPVFIALFGHPNYLTSRFRLTIFSLQRPKVVTYDDMVAKYETYHHDVKSEKSKKEEKKEKTHTKTSHGDTTEEQQPLWLKILLGILEFGIDVII